jgi:hypothetical protein
LPSIPDGTLYLLYNLRMNYPVKLTQQDFIRKYNTAEFFPIDLALFIKDAFAKQLYYALIFSSRLSYNIMGKLISVNYLRAKRAKYRGYECLA